jgi:hypothetical protein
MDKMIYHSSFVHVLDRKTWRLSCKNLMDKKLKSEKGVS